MKEKTYYDEAMRYIDNAKDILKKSPEEDGIYQDEKYVKSAAGTAYAGVDQAAKWFLRMNNVKNVDTKDVTETIKGINKINHKAAGLLQNAYGILHIAAYYRELTGVDAINDGLKYAIGFISYLKPYSNIIPENAKDNLQKRKFQRNR